MAILTKTAILQGVLYGRIKIDPFNKDISDKQIGPNSIDLTLGNQISFYPFIRVQDDGSQEPGDTITFGQTNFDARPEDYGHLAMKLPNDPQVQYLREMPLMDLARYQDTYQTVIPENGFIMIPGNVYLVKVNETLWAKDLVIEVAGISSLSRAGVAVHQTAARANIGDNVQFVLELTCAYPTVIYPNMRIATAFFLTTEGDIPEENLYHGRYEQSKQPNPEMITGYVPDRELVEKIAAMRAEEAEKAAAEEAAYRAAHPEEFIEEIPEATAGLVENVEAPSDSIGYVEEPAEEEPVETLSEAPAPGDTIDMSDMMPGFSAQVISTDTVGEAAPQEFDAEVLSVENPQQ